MSQTSYPATTAARGFSGLIYDASNHDIVTKRNDQAASAAIPFGVAVVQSAAADDVGCKLPSAQTDLVQGVSVHSHAYENRALTGVLGIPNKDSFGCMRKGRIWVLSEDTTVEGGSVFVRHGGSGQIGGFLGADDAGNTSLLAGATWRTTGTGAGLRVLELNLNNGAMTA